MKPLVFTVTNDLTYDQRMIRICGSLAKAGYPVTLVGRKMKGSADPLPQQFRQVRLNCFFVKGPGFYAEYNLRLFLWLLFSKQALICAIDLDTVLPCYFISLLKRIPRVYDAHELFCEMQEIVERPRIYRIWKKIEAFTVPKFRFGYTVNEPIATEFNRMYGSAFRVIRNVPMLKDLVIPPKPAPYILYQGAVNEGRSFETLIPAMKMVNAKLIIAGDGNFMHQAQALVKENGLEEKVEFTGRVIPRQLVDITTNAYIGVTLFEKTGLSNYYSLANRYFDYLHAAVPQLCVDYPVYHELNREKPVALLIASLEPEIIAANLNLLLTNDVLYKELQQNCLYQRQQHHWQQEEKQLTDYYKLILAS